MQFKHTPAMVSASFDDPSLVSAAGLVPMLRLAQYAGLDQPTLFDTWRHRSFFTTTDKNVMGTVEADKNHRGHAIIEQVHAALKNGPLSHLPSGVFTANSAWLVLAVIAFNLTRAAGVIADHAGRLAKATTATIRRTLVSVPARLARSARRITLHLPETWPWQAAFVRLFTAAHPPPLAPIN